MVTGVPEDLALVEATLLAEGGPFEIVDVEVEGVTIRSFKNRIRTLRDLLVKSPDFGDNTYMLATDGVTERTITFAEPARLVASVAAAFRDRHDVQPGDRIAILGANSPEWVIAFWAAISLGAVAVGLNGWSTGPEIRYFIDDCEPKVLVADRKRVERIEGDPGVPVVVMEDDSVITHNTVSPEGWPVVIKRVVDILVSGAMSLLLLPVFLLTALAIKLTSPGPVFFVQNRLGLNKRHFGIYKFRTMVVDAEKRMKEIEHLNEVSGPVFKIKNDPRITPIGKFLRKTSIDELPQLFNVLKGDMSLVGPRPLPLRDYEGFSEDWQRRRFSVRPGVTCLWQIGGRSDVSFEQWMELDLLYIDKWSLLLDFKILLKTIPAVLKGSGAA